MNVKIYEEASDWIVKHRNGGLDAREKRTFDRWLRESPQHMRAYLEMSSVWEDLPALERSWNPSAEELIARARADDGVVALSSQSSGADSSLEDAERQPRMSVATIRQVSAHRGDPSTTSFHRKAGLLYALAASILVTFLSAGWFYLQRGVYSTDIGEQRSLTLVDGSTVELNARSRIKVQYTKGERRIELFEGQALFHVAKNKLRPFVVQTGDTRVRAVGTSFDVYRAKSGTVVTVVEGRVAVHTRQRLPDTAGGFSQSVEPPLGAGSRGAAGRADPPLESSIQATVDEVLIAAGEQVIVTPAAVTHPKRANVAAATAWTRRSLVFDASPLTQVAEEFSRYNVRPLVVKDPQLADFHVSGVFSSVEPTLLLRFLRAQPELVVEETQTEIRIKKREAKEPSR